VWNFYFALESNQADSCAILSGLCITHFFAAAHFRQHPTVPISEVCGNRKAIKAAYRFPHHAPVEYTAFLSTRQQPSLERMKSCAFLLLSHDTTSSTLSGHTQTQGLGPSGDPVDSPQGLLRAPALVFSEKREPQDS